MFDTSVYGSSARTGDVARSRREFDQFREEFEKQEQVKRDAALKPLTALSAEAAREKKLHDFDQECLWSAPLETIKAILNDENRRESMCWLIVFQDEKARTTQTAKSTQEVFSEYLSKLTSRTGLKFNNPARLVLMAKVQWFCGGVEISQASLDAMLDTLLKHSCFADGEIEFDANWKTTAVTPVEQEKPSDDLCPVYEGDLKTRRQALTDEQQKVWLAFTDSVYTNLRFMLNEEQKLYIYNLMRRRGYSFLDPREYDAARIQAVRDKVIPESQGLYPQEALDFYIEQNDVNDPAVKHQIVVRQRIINQDRLRQMNVFGQ